MCNLYDIGPSGNQNSVGWDRMVRKYLRQLPKELGIRKTDPGLVICQESEPKIMRWGFHRAFNPAINNSRSDKLENGMWKEAYQNRRCLIPVAAFYEWSREKGAKQSYAFREKPESETLLWVAGIWEPSAEFGDCYSMITTEAAEWMQSIHHRVPAILSHSKLELWLSGELQVADLSPRLEPLDYFPCENPLKMKVPKPPTAVPTQSEFSFE